MSSKSEASQTRVLIFDKDAEWAQAAASLLSDNYFLVDVETGDFTNCMALATTKTYTSYRHPSTALPLAKTYPFTSTPSPTEPRSPPATRPLTLHHHRIPTTLSLHGGVKTRLTTTTYRPVTRPLLRFAAQNLVPHFGHTRAPRRLSR